MAGVVLAGCGKSEPYDPPENSTSAASAPEGSPSPAANRAPSFDDVKAAIATQSDVGPYSATFKLVTEVNGKTLLMMSGRMNMEGPVSGKITIRYKKVGDQQAGIAEGVVTPKTMYIRAALRRPVTGPWQRMPVTKEDAVAPSLQNYAELMTALGPKVMKKQQRLKGIATTRLSGRIKIARIKNLQRSLYKQLRSVGTNDIGVDLWVDRRGRGLRMEQQLKIGPQRLHHTMVIAKFQRPLTVRPPV
jgi:hypothetical protein